jgi:hypothetical protein
MPESPGTKPLAEDDYCLIIGKVYLDAYLRIQSLEKQLVPMHASFRSQVETLRTQLQDALKERDTALAALKEGAPFGNLGT